MEPLVGPMFGAVKICAGLEPGDPDRRRDALASIGRDLELRPGVFGCEVEVAAWLDCFYPEKSAQQKKKLSKLKLTGLVEVGTL